MFQMEKAAAREAMVTEQRMAYDMKLATLRKATDSSALRQRKACEAAIESTLKKQSERIENSAKGIIIKPGVHRESLRVDGGSLVVHGEDGADAVIWPVDPVPAVQVSVGAGKVLERGDQVKITHHGPHRDKIALIKGKDQSTGNMRYAVYADDPEDARAALISLVAAASRDKAAIDELQVRHFSILKCKMHMQSSLDP